jgi:hypothetical protein
MLGYGICLLGFLSMNLNLKHWNILFHNIYNKN